ncbi:Hypothetical predicted protein [Mytilus galloprovincialis]|uniref:B box-type domain-containing protein n=1 Tax=Mytilus galloprovincialis TaxID=29158 RepID=A0A8B6CBU5_MYTGA|nr:Hypothetical predicted protein [Mytilus galloprovincialis]
MASSKSASVRKAQVPVSCHFCNEPSVQWKCEKCDVFMCTSCKEKNHQQLKSVQDHEIVSTSDIWKDNHPRNEVASEIISSVFNSYTTEVPVINSLLCSGDDFIYFICHKPEERSRLVKGKLLKSSIRILQTLGKQIFDIAVNKEGAILFNEVGNNAASHHFRQNYKRKVVLDTDTKGRKLFSYPARIKTDSKNVLYVADWTDETNIGRLVAVDVHSRLKFTYNGNPNLNAFSPHGIAITPSDNIILSDPNNNALHILNSRGELFGLHFVDKEYKIQRPLSLCIDSEGYLLIGRGLLNERLSDAKLYVAKIAEHFM